MCRSKLQHKFATETKRNLQGNLEGEKMASFCDNEDFVLTMVSKKKKKRFFPEILAKLFNITHNQSGE